MKRLFSAIAVIALLVVLCACGEKHYDESNISELYNETWIVGRSRGEIEDRC